MMNMEDGIIVYHGCLPRITTDLTTNGHMYNNRVAIEGIIYELRISSTHLQLYKKRYKWH